MMSLRDIVDIFSSHWKWFAASVIICLAVGKVYLDMQPRIYKRSAVMLVKDDGSTSGRASRTGTDALMQLNGVMMGTSVKNEVYILQSHQIMKEVVRQLHLDVTYRYKHRLRTMSLYDVKPFTAQFDSAETQRPFVFRTQIVGDKLRVYEVRTAHVDYDFDKVVPFGEAVKLPVGNVTFVADERYLEQFDGKEIKVSRMTIDDAAVAYGAALNSGEIDKESTLVGLTYTDQNIARAEDILSAVLDAYKRSIIIDKNLIAQSTAEFIDERIQIISKDLSRVEGELAAYKQSNRLVSLKEDANAYLQQSAAARQRSIQLESQVGVVQFLLEDLKNNSSGFRLIPTLGGLTDTGIQSQIMKYNDAMLERNRLVESSGENNTRVHQLEDALNQMRAAIISSTGAYLSSLNVQLTRAKQEEAGLSSNLATVPQKEKEIIDISRQQNIKETLYTYLLNKREETALQLAITEANIRIIETPFGSNNPISPRTKVILLVALLIGVILPFTFFYMRNLLNTSVRGRKDVEEYTTVPVLGEVPHRKEGTDEEIVVGDQRTDSLNEAFRIMRFNIGFINKDARVLMFTSTAAGEGKTFVSRNFAVTLSLSGKRVLLVDADIRKRTQTRLAGMRSHHGLTAYLQGAVNKVSDLIVHNPSDMPIDLLPAGATPPNPAELLMSDRLEQLIDELKQSYDYIVIDSVPALAVADASIVNRVADATIYVVREGKVDRRFLPELERMYQEHKYVHLCVIINDAHINKTHYGYGYGNYGYGYGSKKKK